MKDSKILGLILHGKFIKPVYQPIISLSDGRTFGFEALSRISNDKLSMNIEQMFRTADRMSRSWELDKLCRIKALENAASMDSKAKLFINADPNIIHDVGFKSGFTKKRLNKYGLDFHNIIFEITERASIIDHDVFIESIGHYRNQNFGIAIDDVGSGYSGLNTIADVKPDFIKLDVNLVRDIDKDEIKQLLCKAMVDFGKSTEIRVIAEGIETEAELEALIKLHVDFGQGYFLGAPMESFAEIAPEKAEMITKYNKLYEGVLA
jgi:EAL domain-containing protein (putative c-di-GMP-specific phosphodiesterase class I)